MYKALYPTGDVTAFSMYIFRITNLKRKGYIDFVEFLLAINATSQDTVEEKLAWAFTLFDFNGDGKLDLEEMTVIVHVSEEFTSSSM